LSSQPTSPRRIRPCRRLWRTALDLSLAGEKTGCVVSRRHLDWQRRDRTPSCRAFRLAPVHLSARAGAVVAEQRIANPTVPESPLHGWLLRGGSIVPAQARRQGKVSRCAADAPGGRMTSATEPAASGTSRPGTRRRVPSSRPPAARAPSRSPRLARRPRRCRPAHDRPLRDAVAQVVAALGPNGQRRSDGPRHGHRPFRCRCPATRGSSAIVTAPASGRDSDQDRDHGSAFHELIARLLRAS